MEVLQLKGDLNSPVNNAPSLVSMKIPVLEAYVVRADSSVLGCRYEIGKV